jgi:hypothetical protein
LIPDLSGVDGRLNIGERIMRIFVRESVNLAVTIRGPLRSAEA